MFISQNMIAYAIAWVLQTMSIVSLLPQIYLNYKTKTTNGLSDFYLLSYLSGYAIHLCYVYCLDFPTVYKITVPISFFLVLTLVFQRFFCFKHKAVSYLTRLYCATFFSIFLLLIVLSIHFPYKIGHLVGWLSVMLWTVYQLPQIYKIYSKKSVKGFSLLFISLGGFGNLLGLIAALSLGLPVQSVFIALRGLLFYVIFCFQFWMYGKKSIEAIHCFEVVAEVK